MFRIIFTLMIFGFICSNCFADLISKDSKDINQTLINLMQTYHVPIVGYAIIKNYNVVSVATLSIDPNYRANQNSLFQAASISKSVSAYGALKLVSENKLNLDEAVNDRLTSWKIPLNKYNQVTVRQLLDMTSGLSVSGFPGYEQGKKLPTLLEILNGEPPANTPQISVFYQPGSKYFYSGGAFQVLEQLIEDVTQKPFSVWMKSEILNPLSMDHSVFQYPLNKKWQAAAVPGFLLNGKMINGGWNNYVEASAGGLWSTPKDLAKFAINAANAYLGKDNRLITKSVANQMLTRQDSTDFGLGFVVSGTGENLNFRKAGHNLGYHSELIMFPNSGDGMVIMTDSENGEYVINYMIALIAQKNHWPYYFPFFDELVSIPL